MITTNANGQYFLMNPPELIIGNVTMRNQLFKIFLDDPFYAGCFNITDVSLLGSPTVIDNIPGKFYCSISILKRFMYMICNTRLCSTVQEWSKKNICIERFWLLLSWWNALHKLILQWWLHKILCSWWGKNHEIITKKIFWLLRMWTWLDKIWRQLLQESWERSWS